MVISCWHEQKFSIIGCPLKCRRIMQKKDADRSEKEREDVMQMQIGQIVYSFCIITMPLQYLFIHRISIKVWERLLKAHTKNDIIIALCIIIPIYIIFAADILYFFTTTKQTSVFTKCFHTSKICYSLITATVFFVLAMVLSLIIFCAKKIKNQGG